MSRQRLNKRGLAFFMIMGTALVIAVLSGVILMLIVSQSRFTYSGFSRVRAYYSAYAAMNYAFERLRDGSWAPNPVGNPNSKYACLNGCVDAVTPDYTIADGDIPGSVQVRIYPSQSGINNSTLLEIKTSYIIP